MGLAEDLENSSLRSASSSPSSDPPPLLRCRFPPRPPAAAGAAGARRAAAGLGGGGGSSSSSSYKRGSGTHSQVQTQVRTRVLTAHISRLNSCGIPSTTCTLLRRNHAEHLAKERFDAAAAHRVDEEAVLVVPFLLLTRGARFLLAPVVSGDRWHKLPHRARQRTDPPPRCGESKENTGAGDARRVRCYALCVAGGETG